MLLPLDALHRADAPRVGAKAARLGELSARGLPVPPGFVVPAAAYEGAIAAHPPLAAAISALAPGDDAYAQLAPLFMRMPLPTELEAALRAAVDGLGDVALAVRSSAPGEDGAAASFAGQQQTFLNARGGDQVLACLKGCWAGAWAAGVQAYKHRLGDAAPPTMAVIVQVLVVPEAAGVAFTADPVTGERDRIVVDASWGLGEAVVSGQATPDRVVLAKADGRLLAYDIGAKEVEVRPEGRGTRATAVDPARRAARCLPDAALALLHRLAADVERVLGPDQDLEFAWEGGRLWLLQARPITAMPPAPPPGGWVAPGDGVWERRNFAEHFPGPLSPLAETLVLPAVSRALVELAASLGMGLGAPALVAVHGVAYARSDTRKRPAIVLKAPWVYARLMLGHPARWERGERHMARIGLRLKHRPDDAAGLVAWAEGMASEYARTWADVHRLSAGWRWSEHVLRVLLGGRMDLAAGFLANVADGELEALAGAIAAEAPPAVRAAILGPDPLAALAALGPDGEPWRIRLDVLAARGAGFPATFDPAAPLPLASPAAAAGLVAQALGIGFGGEQRARAAAAGEARSREAAATRPGWQQLALRIAVPWARRFAAAREPALSTLGRGFGAYRAGLLALGEQLVRPGGLAEPEDVFWLPWPAVRALAGLGGEAPVDPAAVAAAARAHHALQAAYAPPLRLGGPPERLPTHAILGIPAGGGQATGVVRVVRGPEDFASFLPGEILVAPTTTPAWTPLFARAAAIVTDVGGPLSHGSIVAREFGLPAVLGTESATRRLKDGDLVTVDGDQGVVWPAC